MTTLLVNYDWSFIIQDQASFPLGLWFSKTNHKKCYPRNPQIACTSCGSSIPHSGFQIPTPRQPPMSPTVVPVEKEAVILTANLLASSGPFLCP